MKYFFTFAKSLYNLTVMKRLNIIATVLQVISIMLLLSGCLRSSSADNLESREMSYAGYLAISDSPDGFTSIEVLNPWRKGEILQRYILVPKGTPVPENLPKGTLIRTPVERIVVFSSLYYSMIDELGASEKVVGVCDSDYLTDQNLIERLRNGLVTDCGNSVAADIEKIISTKADLIIVSPFENSNYGGVEKCGIPIMEAADYMESHPLARVEWIKFYGELLCNRRMADSTFNVIKSRYENTKESISEYINKTKKERPALMVERKYGSSWGVPGGDSYMSILYSDAGANNIFASYKSQGSVQLSFEKVLEQAIDADIWLIKYTSDTNLSYEDLKAEYPLYAKFAPFANRKIFGCNTLKVPYYETIALHPEIILNDLAHIFHPELFPGYSQKYFFPLEQSMRSR